jgi:hypothetical protein
MSTPSPILGFPLVEANQNQKEATIATALTMLEAAEEDLYSVNLASGNVTLNSTQWASAKMYVFTGHTVARTVNTPSPHRFVVFLNTGTGAVTVGVNGSGGNTVTVAAGALVCAMSDGTHFWSLSSNDYDGVKTYTADRTLDHNDYGNVIDMNKSTAVSVFFEDNTDVIMPSGVTTAIRQLGAGQVSLFPTSSVQQFRKPADRALKTRAQNSIIFVQQTSANDYLVWGDLAYATGAGPDSGTNFPSSPSSGDRFYRSDREIGYYYDGSRWLSEQVYTTPISVTSALIPTTTSPTTGYGTPSWFLARDFWVEKAIISSLVATTNNGSNYWTLAADRVSITATTTSLGSRTTAADTVNQWKRVEIAVGALWGTSDPAFSLTCTKTGTPGALTVSAVITGRMVG